MKKLLIAINEFYKSANIKISKQIKPKVYKLKDGFVIHRDSLAEETIDEIKNITKNIPLICTDPPYGKIVTDDWDNPDLSQKEFADWLLTILDSYAPLQKKKEILFICGEV